MIFSAPAQLSTKLLYSTLGTINVNNNQCLILSILWYLNHAKKNPCQKLCYCIIDLLCHFKNCNIQIETSCLLINNSSISYIHNNNQFLKFSFRVFILKYIQIVYLSKIKFLKCKIIVCAYDVSSNSSVASSVADPDTVL